MKTATTIKTVLLTVSAFGLAAHVGSQATASATYVDAARVSAAFAKGMALVETAGYKIHASRRDAPGKAEVHVRDTDIIYVLEGSATIVTGGDVIEGKALAESPEEIRGTSIRGGAVQRLAKGDVFIVPNGVAHQFTEVSAPFLYYVVKATDGAGR